MLTPRREYDFETFGSLLLLLLLLILVSQDSHSATYATRSMFGKQMVPEKISLD